MAGSVWDMSRAPFFFEASRPLGRGRVVCTPAGRGLPPVVMLGRNDDDDDEEEEEAEGAV